MSYTNADGLFILTNGDEGVSKGVGSSLADPVKRLVMQIPDATKIPLTPAAPAANDPFLPANAFITNAYLVVKTAFAGATAVLNIGLQTAAGVAIAAQGIDAAIAQTALTANKAVVCDGTYVKGTTTVGAVPAYLSIDVDTAAFTAGAATLVVEYITN